VSVWECVRERERGNWNRSAIILHKCLGYLNNYGETTYSLKY
jgi:hypothetical protein